LGRRF